MSIINGDRPSVNSDSSLYDPALDGLVFDQGPFPETYLHSIDEGTIPLDPEVYQSLFEPTDDDRADYRQMVGADYDYDDEATEVCEPRKNLVDELVARAEHYESLETEVGTLIAQAIREKVSEGIFLGYPTSLDVWQDREATARGWHGA